MRRSRVCGLALAAALVLQGATACGSSDEGGSSGSTGKNTPQQSSGSGSGTTSDKAPAEVEKFELEKVADLPKSELTWTAATPDGILAIGRDSNSRDTLVRIGTDGKVTGPVPVGDEISVFGLFVTDSAVIASGSTYGFEDSKCGLAKVDTTSLTLGPLDNSLKPKSDSSGCGTPAAYVDGSTLAASYGGRLVVMDTSSGKSETVDISGDAISTSGVAGNEKAFFVWYPVGEYDPDAETQKVEVARVDREKLSVTARATLDGYPYWQGGRLRLSESASQQGSGARELDIDLTTLKTSPVEETRFQNVCESHRAEVGTTLPLRVAEAGGRIWVEVYSMDDKNVLTGFDVKTCEKTAEITGVDRSTDGNERVQIFAVGDEILVLRSKSSTKPGPDGYDVVSVDSVVLYKADVS